MTITQDELQSIVSAVLSSIRTNSQTIDQLSPVTQLGDDDSFEIAGGKKTTFKLMKKTTADYVEQEIIEKKITPTIKKMEEADTALKGRFDALVGENASEAIDNFTEVLAFLDGLTDTEKLSSKLARLGTGLSEEETAREAGDEALADSIALERLRTLALEQAVWPLDVTFSVAPSTIETGKTTEVTASWGAMRSGKDILAAATVTLFAGTETVATEAEASNKKTTLSPAAPGDTEFRLTVGYEGMTREASATVKAVHPSYFGKVAADATVNVTAVTALTKMLNPTRTMTQQGQSLSNQRLVYAYPKAFGALSSVKDGNNFETLTAYTCTELTIGGVAYYVYAMATPVTATGVKQIYS